MPMVDDMFEVGYGQATSDGDYDDVSMYESDGSIVQSVTTANGIAWCIIVGSLVLLWVFGAALFKGANHS